MPLPSSTVVIKANMQTHFLLNKCTQSLCSPPPFLHLACMARKGCKRGNKTKLRGNKSREIFFSFFHYFLASSSLTLQKNENKRRRFNCKKKMSSYFYLAKRSQLHALSSITFTEVLWCLSVTNL